MRDLSFITFEGKTSQRPGFACACPSHALVAPPEWHVPGEPLDDFVSWLLGRAGLDASAYRPQSLDRRVPACLRVLRVRSPRAARTLLERRPGLIAAAVSALLIGATEFFREAEVFDVLRARVLPQLAAQDRRLRIWSAGCSTGAELYSVAILLSEAGLLERSCLLGTDCRGDAIQAAEVGLFDAAMLDRLPATRDKYFAPMERKWRVIEALRRQICWKVADVLAGVEEGPWDIILWRNVAIYLRPDAAATTWRRLAAALAPRGALVVGKADRPPLDAGLSHAGRCIYCRAQKDGQEPARRFDALCNVGTMDSGCDGSDRRSR